MDRFVAMLWDARDESATRRASGWQGCLKKETSRWASVLDAPGFIALSLIQRSDQPITTPFEVGDGIVVGPLFTRGQESSGRSLSLPRVAALRVVASNGGELIERYWGNYLAMWRNPDTNAVHVLRDPCGAAPCFMTHAHGVDILCSYVPDIANLPDLRFSVDWNGVRAFLANNFFVTRKTALSEISELLPGEQMVWRQSAQPTRSWAWNAMSLAANPHQQSFEEVRSEFRTTTEACFVAWGSTYRNILVHLSGGLDSSILINLLRGVSDARVTGLHLIGRGYESFERRLAQLAAKRARVELLEVETGASINLAAIVDGPRLARPTKQILSGAVDDRVRDVCDPLGVDCTMAGHGGDSLFLQRSLAGDAFADYLSRNGIGEDFWRIAYETAVLLQRPIWDVVGGAGAHAIGRVRRGPNLLLSQASGDPDGVLTTDAIRNLPTEYTSDLRFSDLRHLPPCKAQQVESILALRNYYAVCGQGIECDAIYPFISQPIVELSLQTPSYLFGWGGGERALERAAFADILPDAIVRRTEKGFVNHQLTSELVDNIAYLRELVLDGEVTTQDGIDRRRAERILTQESLQHSGGLESALNLVAAEAWLTAWRNPP